MRERLRFGILGCGVIGRTHAEAIASVPEAELVAVADELTDRAREVAGRWDVHAYGDLTDMLEGADLDVVNICTPSGMHAEGACAAMRAGCHVVVEKPIEIRLDRIDEMLRVQEEAGVKLAAIFQHRLDPAALQLRALVEEDALGRLVLGNAHVLWWRSQEYYDSGAWRGTWVLDGGGVLMNQSIHSIDLLQWLMGPVRSIQAYVDTLVHRMETEDAAVAVLRFAGGALGTIAGTTGAYPGVTTRVELFGDGGSAIIADDALGYLHLRRDDAGAAPSYGVPPGVAPVPGGSGATSNPAAVGARGHAAQIADLIRAVREDGTPMVDGREARRSVEIILGIYESARTGREVVLT